MRKVKAGFVRIYQRAFLLHMRAEHFTQRLVHQVRRGMVSYGAGTTMHVYLRRDRIPHGEFTSLDSSKVAEHIGLNFLRVFNSE